jgi:hypothetical protein
MQLTNCCCWPPGWAYCLRCLWALPGVRPAHGVPSVGSCGRRDARWRQDRRAGARERTPPQGAWRPRSAPACWWAARRIQRGTVAILGAPSDPRSTRRRPAWPGAGPTSGQERGRGRADRGAFGRLAASRPCPAGPTVRGVRWNRHAAPAGPCPPARWAGRSLAARPRAVTPGERPEDPPARGDRHRARLGDGQGPHMQLLAEARRPPSVHPADLRLALPGLPHQRPAVLQPRRSAVPGAWHRAAGCGAGPAVAGQGSGQAPNHARRIAP